MNVINFDDLIDPKYRRKYTNDNPLTIQHPSYTLLVGKSGGGKTNLLMNLLMNKDIKMSFNRLYIICKDPKEDKYMAILDHFTKIEEKIKKKTGEHIPIITITTKLEELPDLDKDIDPNKQNVVVFDDLVLTKNQKMIEDYYIRCRKVSVSAIYLTQSFFKVPRIIRLNVDYFCIFTVPSRRELNNLYQEFGGDIDSQKSFNMMVRESTKTKSFFMIDLKTIVPHMRYRRSFDRFWILPENGQEDAPKQKIYLREI